MTTQTDASQTKIKYYTFLSALLLLIPLCSDFPSQDSLRRRIQRIETLLHGRQTTNEPQQSISSALSGIEKLLRIPPLEHGQERNAILMPSLMMDSITSPTTLPSPAGSSCSQIRPVFLAEANHKRWGADSAIGQSWSKVRHTLSSTDVDFRNGS